MKKMVILGVTILTALTLVSCGNTNSSTSSKNATNSSKKSESKNAITMTKYNSIKIGDISTGVGGTSEKIVKDLYGKPITKSETTVAGSSKKATSYAWSNVGSSLQGASVTAEFLNGKAVGKAYSNFTKSTKISNTTYKSIQTGATLKSVKQKLGTPSSESIVGSSGLLSAQVLTYLNSDGSKTLALTFSDNKLTSKSATSIK